jgi:hypothetical protein
VERRVAFGDAPGRRGPAWSSRLKLVELAQSGGAL